MKRLPLTLLSSVLVTGAVNTATALSTLWQIGEPDRCASEFVLFPNNHERFLARFGSPDHAFYIGLSNAEEDWPYVLPGPLDAWAGSGWGDGRWDQMNTLPIGFVLDGVPPQGNCVFAIDLCDTHPKSPPNLRVLINGTHFDRELPPGSDAASLTNGATVGKPHSVRIEFPAALLRVGYNEISLRHASGSWALFDALRLETPAGARLAAPSPTIIRSVSAADYTVSPNRKERATVRIEVFRYESPGRLRVELGSDHTSEVALTPGLQIVEIPVCASRKGHRTKVRVLDVEAAGKGGHVLHEAKLTLPPSRRATPADYVDVFQGTAHSRWMIAPGPWMPFGMVKLSPDNQTQGWIAGYDYSLEHIDCFSHIHEWTMAGLGMMPTLGPLRTRPGLDGNGYSSRFDKASERGGVGYYDVRLKDTGIRVELAATTRASLQRYTFPACDPARVLIDFLIPNEYETRVLTAQVRRTGPAEIEGTVETLMPDVWFKGDHQRFDLHFVAQLNRPFDTLGGWQQDAVLTNLSALSGSNDCGVFLEFKTREGEPVSVRTGISLVSRANARLNLEQELSKPFGWDFAAVVEHQRKAWNQWLNRVEIETPDAREKTQFYSNLYRALAGRNIWSDVNGEWMDPAERRQRLQDPDAVMLGCDAFWNTFWNLNQVMNLLTPEWSARWVNSQLALYDTCGWLAKGPAGLEYISVMVAEHEVPLLVAAHQAGVRGFDAAKAYEACRKMQTTLPIRPPGDGHVGNENLEAYLKYGYVPFSPRFNDPGTWRRWLTSNTLEYSYDDWTLAQFALALGRQEDYAAFMKRSEYWRNVFDPHTGFMRPKTEDGTWVEPFDPYRTPGFTEGNAWQYTWFVPHNVPGLADAMGRERFVARLNEAFEKSEPTRFNAAGERFDEFPINHGNQPTMQAAWLFNWVGQPWLSQKWTRAILDSYYGHTPADAYLGDEDQGQMSAWFVMAALGLFQTDGGCRAEPIYELGSPLYPKVVLRLSKEHYGGKTFTILTRNASKTNRFIQSAKLNGRVLDSWWIPQKEVLRGGTLEIELGPQPNRSWAAQATLPAPQSRLR